MRANAILLLAAFVAGRSTPASRGRVRRRRPSPPRVNDQRRGDPAARRGLPGLPCRAGITRIVADLNVQFQTDPRISDIFRATDLIHLQSELADQLCYLTGGPCAYAGKDMKTAHKDLGLQDADLNALLEDLQNAMDREGVPSAFKTTCWPSSRRCATWWWFANEAEHNSWRRRRRP